MDWLRNGLHGRALRWVLTVFFVISILAAILNWDTNWSTALILLALILIIEQVLPVEQIRADVKFLRDINERVAVNSFATSKAFFEELRLAIGEAKFTADLTHIRDEPPEKFGSTEEEYYDYVFRWVEEAEDRSVRRIIAMRNTDMRAWAETLAAYETQCPRFEVRVVDWSIDAPAVNMAIVDGQAVFLALTGDSIHRTGGIAVEAEDVASYFRAYYDNLWRASTPLGVRLNSGPRDT